MPYAQRMDFFRQIEAARERPLICLVTSIRPNAGGQIAPDVIPELIKQIIAIPEDRDAVDLLVVSNGGDGLAAARIMSLLRGRFSKIAVLVPYAAYSAATLLALGAEEIIMHPFSNLGPVDPQITVTRQGPGGVPERLSYGTEDLRNYFDFVRNDVRISDQEQMAKAFEMLCREVGSIPIGVAKRSAQLSLALGEQLLSWHIQDKSKARAITETLSTAYHHHGYALGPADAEKMGLPVTKATGDLASLMWAVWQDLEQEMLCNTPFEPLEVIWRDPNAAALLGQ